MIYEIYGTKENIPIYFHDIKQRLFHQLNLFMLYAKICDFE